MYRSIFFELAVSNTYCAVLRSKKLYGEIMYNQNTEYFKFLFSLFAHDVQYTLYIIWWKARVRKAMFFAFELVVALSDAIYK